MPTRTRCATRSRRARRRLERDQRPHAVADQRGAADAGRVEQREQPVGERLDARERRAGAAPMAGQVEREHARSRGARTSATAASRRCGRAARRGRRRRTAGGVERLAAGVGVGRRAGPSTTSSFIARLAPRAFSARFRSSIRSSASSRPIDSRIVPAPMPARASAASSIRKCVVDAGWMTSERQSPTLARCENSFSASMKRRPARASRAGRS